MPRKLCPKLILEGTRLTFKTETAFALNEHPRVVGPRKYRYHSPIVSAEWCGFTNVPWGRGLINYALAEEARALETYRTWLRLFQLQRYCSWIIDRFHLSTLAFQKRERGHAPALDWLDAGLADLNFRLVLLTRTAESFASARELRLKVSGNPAQYDDLGLFVEEQEALRTLAKESRLVCHEFDVSHNDIARTTEEIADWLDQSGGLYMEEPEA